MINIWRYLFVMCLTSVGMVLCLVLGAITGEILFRDIGLGFVITGVSVLVVMVYRMRYMFKSMGGKSSFGEKTWRSYPRDGE